MSDFIEQELAWAEKCAVFRSRNAHKPLPWSAEPAPAPSGFSCGYSQFIRLYALAAEERLLLVLTFMAAQHPGFMSQFQSKAARSLGQAHEDPVTGWMQGAHYPGVLPSAYFFMYLVAGHGLKERLEVASAILRKEYTILRDGAVHLMQPQQYETVLTGYFRLVPEFFLRLAENAFHENTSSNT